MVRYCWLAGRADPLAEPADVSLFPAVSLKFRLA
jgi:hypothetical protein